MLTRTGIACCPANRRFIRATVAALALLTVFGYAVLLPLFTATFAAPSVAHSEGSSARATVARQLPDAKPHATADPKPLSSTSLSLTGAADANLEDLAYASVVPILHQSWKTRDLPPRFRRWSQSFARCHPSWRRRLWTDADNEDLIARHFPWFLPTYRKFKWPVQRADVSRLFYMYKYGGTYCDLDCECLQPFDHLLTNVSLAFGAMDGHSIDPKDDRYVEEGQIENSFMYSIPEHPFVMQLIRQVEKKPVGDPEETTGPYMLMRQIHKLRRSNDSVPDTFRGKKYLEIFPPSFFNPFSWIDNKVPACKDKGGFARADEEKCRAAHSNSSYVLQYHTQVWLAGEKHLNKD